MRSSSSPLLRAASRLLEMPRHAIASKLTREAALHPRFRQIMINFNEANQRIATYTKRLAHGYSTAVQIQPLNHDKAVEAAADAVGKFCVFSLAGGLVISCAQSVATSVAETLQQIKSIAVMEEEIKAIQKTREEMAHETKLLKQRENDILQIMELQKRFMQGHQDPKPSGS